MENPVKKLVRAGHWVYYEVQVSHAVNQGVSYPSQLHCKWAQLDATGQVLPATWTIIDLPIHAPSSYAGATVPKGKVLANLATAAKTFAGTSAHAFIGAKTTLGFDEVLLDDPVTLGAQYRVMKPLVTALNQLGLNKLFATNGALQSSVFHAMASVKPTAEEAAARQEIDVQTGALRAATTKADSDAAGQAIDELEKLLKVFTEVIDLRADASDAAAGTLLSQQYSASAAAQFSDLIGEQAAAARRDRELTVQSTQAVIRFAKQLLFQHSRTLEHLERPQTPNQSLHQNDQEEKMNVESTTHASNGSTAWQHMVKRRLTAPKALLAQAPQSVQAGTKVLSFFNDPNKKADLSSANLSAEATTIGQTIEHLATLLPLTTDALAMVVNSLYQTKTRAFNEYARWLLVESRLIINPFNE